MMLRKQYLHNAATLASVGFVGAAIGGERIEVLDEEGKVKQVVNERSMTQAPDPIAEHIRESERRERQRGNIRAEINGQWAAIDRACDAQSPLPSKAVENILGLQPKPRKSRGKKRSGGKG